MQQLLTPLSQINTPIPESWKISPCTQPLKGTVVLQGDKSISHRALLIAAQAIGTTSIHHLLECDDLMVTLHALQQLGVKIEKHHHVYYVTGVGLQGLVQPRYPLEMGNSGTSARLLIGMLSPYPYTVYFYGDASLSARPMKRVIKPMQVLGASIEAYANDYLPLQLKGSANPTPFSYTLSVQSAQVKSAILLAALNTSGTMHIHEPTLTRDHTEILFEAFGVHLHRKKEGNFGQHLYLKGPQQPQAIDLTIPTDPSAAAFLVVAALLTEDSSLIIPNVCINPLRIGLYITLKEMGGTIRFENSRVLASEACADIHVSFSKLHGVCIPKERVSSMIDEFPILSVAAACATGVTKMKGLAELRFKESNRLYEIVRMLRHSGVDACESYDDLIIQGVGSLLPGGVVFDDVEDHRMVMSMSILGMLSRAPVVIKNMSCINTSFPNFINTLKQLGVMISPTQPKHSIYSKFLESSIG